MITRRTKNYNICLFIVVLVVVVVSHLLFQSISDQNFIGSVVIQSAVDGDDEDSDDDDDTNFDSSGTIFGITSAVNISKSQNHGCIEDIRKHIQTKCDQFAGEQDKQAFSSALNDDTKQVGLLINERFINIPAQISVPLLENLQKEIHAAATKKPKYRFDWYMMIVKFNRKMKKDGGSGGDGGGKAKHEDIYTNEEEDIVDEYTDASFEYSAERETDSTLSGNWTESDSTLVPYRKVVIFESTKLPFVIDAIKSLVCE